MFWWNFWGHWLHLSLLVGSAVFVSTGAFGMSCHCASNSISSPLVLTVFSALAQSEQWRAERGKQASWDGQANWACENRPDIPPGAPRNGEVAGIGSFRWISGLSPLEVEIRFQGMYPRWSICPCHIMVHHTQTKHPSKQHSFITPNSHNTYHVLGTVGSALMTEESVHPQVTNQGEAVR